MDEPLIITKAYDLILYLMPQIAKFPKQQRYTLGERLEGMMLDFLSLLIDARYTRDKGNLLRQAGFHGNQRGKTTSWLQFSSDEG